MANSLNIHKNEEDNTINKIYKSNDRYWKTKEIKDSIYIYIYIIGVSEFKYITNGTENLYKDIREQTFLIKKTTLIYI